MDMPDDTPTKITHKHQSNQNQQSEEDNFSSFQSNHKHQNNSQKSLDQKGFRNFSSYKEKQISFPTVPHNLGKLYQIYIHNVNRKKQLKKQIQQLIQKQLKALRVAYDKQSFSIEQFIDLDQQSRQYIASKENFQKRRQELQKLAREYKQFKIAHVQSMMMSNELIRTTLNNYVEKYKKILQTYVLQDTVAVLCQQRYRPKKLGKLRVKNQKKGTKKLLSQQQMQQQANNLQRHLKSRNASQTSEDEQQSNLLQKYMFRYFKFYKNQSGVYFQPLEHYIQLPSGKDWIGFIIQPYSKEYIAYQKQNLHVLSTSTKELKIKSTIPYDKPIKFCQIMKNWLYVGTEDGIIWVYDIKQGTNQITLLKFALCSNGNSGPVTHFALTNNPDIVIFVIAGVFLYEMNLSTYSSFLLSQLPEQVKSIDSKMLITKNMCYINYYAGGPTHGKAILQQNEKLNSTRKNKEIVKIHRHGKEEFLIYNEGHGVLSINEFL